MKQQWIIDVVRLCEIVPVGGVMGCTRVQRESGQVGPFEDRCLAEQSLVGVSSGPGVISAKLRPAQRHELP